MIKFISRLIMLACLLGLLPAPFPVFAADIFTFQDEKGVRYYTNTPVPGCTKVRFPLVMKKGGSSARAHFSDLKKRDYEPLIVQASTKYSVDSDIVRAVIKVESNFNNRAVSPKGAQGLMQLMPQTARELGVTDPFEPESNIHGGVLYLSRLLNTLNGDLPLSLAAYNAGLERVIAGKKIPAIRETRNYVQQVMSQYSKLKGY
ncbi:MAG: transglycosylase SLT domain-containing protein [Smithella sp.]